MDHNEQRYAQKVRNFETAATQPHRRTGMSRDSSTIPHLYSPLFFWWKATNGVT
jgi:hypothetical protein